MVLWPWLDECFCGWWGTSRPLGRTHPFIQSPIHKDHCTQFCVFKMCFIKLFYFDNILSHFARVGDKSPSWECPFIHTEHCTQLCAYKMCFLRLYFVPILYQIFQWQNFIKPCCGGGQTASLGALTHSCRVTITEPPVWHTHVGILSICFLFWRNIILFCQCSSFEASIIWFKFCGYCDALNSTHTTPGIQAVSIFSIGSNSESADKISTVTGKDESE